MQMKHFIKMLNYGILEIRSNDLGFVINGRHLVMSECQSSINWNIPMRCLGYVSRTLENLAGKEGLYGKNLVKLPAPEFYLFYVGKAEWKSKTLSLEKSALAEKCAIR